MPRRKQQSSKKRRNKAAAAKKGRARANRTPFSSAPQPRQDPSPTTAIKCPGINKRPIVNVDSVDAADPTRSKKIRRRSSLHSHPHQRASASCPTVLVSTALLPLAVYQPASLFFILLVASILPKNSFSLRWLTLSGGVGGHEVGGRKCLAKNGVKLFAPSGSKLPSSLLSLALGVKDRMPCEEIADEGVESENFEALWKDVAVALEKTISTSSSTAPPTEDNEIQEWSIDSIVDMIPRGGNLERDGSTYAGLVNLGNTCYLNAQLQCAYHVPYLRQLILNAKDEVVEVEVEVEVEEEDDGQEEAENEGEKQKVETSVPARDDVDGPSTEPVAAENSSELENTPESQSNDEAVVPPPKKTIIKKEIKQEIKPISNALRALQHTFNSLSRSASSGSTNVLCRTLGINPYLQQDGQEFWKLFVPEVDYSKLASLYSGSFEDYVREIIPQSDEMTDLVEEDSEEEKKEDYIDQNSRNETVKEARERVRTEPFLDLSIPVAEGTGSSVESTLREMFTEPEILRVSEGNGWRPSKGAEKVDAYKGSSLKSDGLPSLLQLHLKRFKYDWETGETSKINDCCPFPLELDLSQVISEIEDESGAIYDLQSIVIHQGEYGSGHYYSYVRPAITRNEWLRFDDEFVTPVEYSDVVADAFGGSRRKRRKQLSSDSFENTDSPLKRRRGLLSRLFSLLRLFIRVPLIGSSNSAGGGGFGYGGRASSAYMLQYARRSDMSKLYPEEHEE